MRLLYAALVLFPLTAHAAEQDMFRHSGLPIPRFVSLKSDTINVRVGPGKRYPIRWVYKRKDLPIEVIEEFGHWRKIRDYHGDEGWTHHTLLSGKRTAMVMKRQRAIHLSPDEKSQVIANLSPEVPALVLSCNTAWCHVVVREYDGWMKRTFLWGIYEEEELK